MGFSSPARVVFVLFFVAEAVSLATPQLQLSQTALFTIAPPQAQTVAGTILALNVGDGNLKLSLSPSASWISVASVRTTKRTCHAYSNATQCFAYQITVDTTGLPNGVATGSIDVTSPNAHDAPQNIVITIVVGGPAPLNLYVPPTGTAVSANIPTDTNTFSVNLLPPLDQSVQLTVVEPVLGTWPFTNREFEFSIQTTAATGTPVGVYDAAYTVSGLASPAENATVPLYIHVTNRPIAFPSTAELSFTSPAASAAQSQAVTFSNIGLGTLTISSASSDSSWLSAAVGSGNTVTLTADPSTLTPGSYNGSVTVAGNEANPVVLSVTLLVTSSGPPNITSVSGGGASTPSLPLGEFVTILGSNFTASPAQTADSTQVLPTSINGTSVLVGSEAAPLLSVAFGSITFQVPYDANASYLQVARTGSATSDPFPIQIVACAPVLTSIVNSSGVRLDANASNGNKPPIVDPNSTITILGHGFGATSPTAPSGTPIPVPSLFGPSAFLVSAEVQFALDSGAVLQTVNLKGQLIPHLIDQYQVMATVPAPPSTASAPVDVDIAVQVCGRSSNALTIHVK